MPSKKKTTRAAQLQPQPQPTQSDYETDTANVTDVLPSSMVPPPERSIPQLNLLVLKRYVPDIERIIEIAPFAVVYLFSPETQQWEKSGVEGTLFVCQLSRSQYPRYNVVILNRKSLDNFITELVCGEDIEITEQYVILQVLGEDNTPNIYGLWIFEEENVPSKREVVANAIQACALQAEHARTMADEANQNDEAPPSYNLDGAQDSSMDDTPPPAPAQSSGQQIDLLSLFNKPAAQVEQTHSQNRTESQPMPPYSIAQQSHFSSTADNDFFRSVLYPAAPNQQQSPAPQQHALLDLFKSKKRE